MFNSIVCRDGVFHLPEEIVDSLRTHSKRGFVYLREDGEVLTISSNHIEGSRRRVLRSRFRSFLFRAETQLAVIDLRGSVRVMGVGTAA